MPLSWLEKPEIDLPEVLEQFNDLRAYYLAMSNGSIVKFWTRLAEKMSQAINRPDPWSWRYVQGVLAGTVGPSPLFGRAVRGLGEALDETPPAAIDTGRVIVLARPGQVREGSVVLGRSKACKRAGCRVWFVPVVPWQRYCSDDCREKTTKERRSRRKPQMHTDEHR